MVGKNKVCMYFNSIVNDLLYYKIGIADDMNSCVFTIWILVKLSKFLKYDWIQNVLIQYVSVVTSLLNLLISM